MKPCKTTCLILILMTVLMLCLGGCYERVVKTRGVGTSHIKTYEPNLKNPDGSFVDDLFGEDEPED